MASGARDLRRQMEEMREQLREVLASLDPGAQRMELAEHFHGRQYDGQREQIVDALLTDGRYEFSIEHDAAEGGSRSSYLITWPGRALGHPPFVVHFVCDWRGQAGQSSLTPASPQDVDAVEAPAAAQLMAEPEPVSAPDLEPQPAQPAPVPMSDEARRRRIRELEAEIAAAKARQHEAKIMSFGNGPPVASLQPIRQPHWTDKRL